MPLIKVPSPRSSPAACSRPKMASQHDLSKNSSYDILQSAPLNINHAIPHLCKTEASSQLKIHGKPFLMLAGELHNSSLSDPAYMRTVWRNIKAANINTLLGSVTWEMVEPVEGQFNFAQLDQIILDARTFNIHLVLLWFGTFKNALSTYAPGWVKRDVKRFQNT